MSMQKNIHNPAPGGNQEDQQPESLRNDSITPGTHTGKRSAFNEDSDLTTNPPGRKRNLADPNDDAGDENYEDEETEDDDYFEEVHQRNKESERLRENQKEFEGYGDEDYLDKP